MIYIDPPYNTGKEFIYPDKFSEPLETYLAYTGQKDSEGRKFSTNTDTTGRYHSNWLNMIYPRLYLAKNLLMDDGVIFISIDDNEAANLRKICDEIFGEGNFISDITVVSNLSGRNDRKYISTANERLLMYVKSPEFEEYGLDLPDNILATYNKEDKIGKYNDDRNLRKTGDASKREDRPNMYYPIYFDPESGNISLSQSEKFSIEVLPVNSKGEDGRWRWAKDNVEKNLSRLVGKKVKGKEKYNIYEKVYLEENGELKRINPKSVMSGKDYSSTNGTKSYEELMENIEFDNPKPVELLKDLIKYSASPDSNSIFLDFFAGSSTTAQAVMELNKEDGGNRKFIMVQLPEPIKEDSLAYKEGYRTIADIGKERIRRSSKQIEEEINKQLDLKEKSKIDLGFKVFKLDRSNFKVWESNIDKIENLEQQLINHVNHISDSSTQEDILYELLLKSGFPLTTKVEKIQMASKELFSINEGSLLICLEKELTQEIIDAIAEANPKKVICLDDGFQGNDQLKTNAVYTFKTRAQKEGREIEFKTV